ncbi:MAG: DNA protecting protein DprA [Candidatus Doudnabacteria bacterium RIFCSPHIGHO2_01_FULL_43_23]|uniref:DNA protecting protein DprA n=1 Tax=Candidatus Doudnabacteria bacterium RIFCSPHIGHO2_01_FULL_43_23 TaxID=1817822 RepID=A0A1F5NR63_9BACT|nr:MAG: DNA protecting protein DprA [Candidatus Doudnabacteria bacterium RIFCSPHIGHO2_01_FULL_43_23]
MLQDTKYYNALNQIPQIGAVRFHKLLNYFPNMETAWQAQAQDLVKAGIESNISDLIVTKRSQIDPDAEMQKLLKEDVKILIFGEENYPKLLAEIYNPPMVLYGRGNLEVLKHEYIIAVVGTRKISNYGKQVTPIIVGDLAKAGVAIVSGLALGVDSIAHRATIEANGKTIAVLGSGIDDNSIYPASNRTIAKSIIDSGGAIISELPIYSLPLKIHFPYRNRIISGLALGTVVIEADVTSGALITAKAALEHNRQVFAVPGSVFNKVSQGPNNLLKMGAKPVTSAADILDELNLQSVTSELKARKIIADSPAEETILKLLSNEPTHINKLIKESGLTSQEISSALTMMEIKGKVRNLGAMQYVISR